MSSGIDESFIFFRGLLFGDVLCVRNARKVVTREEEAFPKSSIHVLDTLSR